MPCPISPFAQNNKKSAVCGCVQYTAREPDCLYLTPPQIELLPDRAYFHQHYATNWGFVTSMNFLSFRLRLKKHLPFLAAIGLMLLGTALSFPEKLVSGLAPGDASMAWRALCMLLAVFFAGYGASRNIGRAFFFSIAAALIPYQRVCTHSMDRSALARTSFRTCRC